MKCTSDDDVLMTSASSAPLAAVNADDAAVVVFRLPTSCVLPPTEGRVDLPSFGASSLTVYATISGGGAPVYVAHGYLTFNGNGLLKGK